MSPGATKSEIRECCNRVKLNWYKYEAVLDDHVAYLKTFDRTCEIDVLMTAYFYERRRKDAAIEYPRILYSRLTADSVISHISHLTTESGERKLLIDQQLKFAEIELERTKWELVLFQRTIEVERVKEEIYSGEAITHVEEIFPWFNEVHDEVSACKLKSKIYFTTHCSNNNYCSPLTPKDEQFFSDSSHPPCQFLEHVEECSLHSIQQSRPATLSLIHI